MRYYTFLYIKMICSVFDHYCAILDGAMGAGRGVVAGLRLWRAESGEATKMNLRLTYIVCQTMLSGNDPELSR